MNYLKGLVFLALIGVCVGFGHDVQAIDTNSPTLIDATFVSNPGDTINTDEGLMTYTFTFTATDDSAGVCVSCSDLYFSASSVYNEGSIERISGDALSGQYRGSVTIPQYEAAFSNGRIVLNLEDYGGNDSYYHSTLHQYLGLSTYIANTGVQTDGTDPVLTSLPEFSPSAINTDDDYQGVRVRFSATDELSGVCAQGDGCERVSYVNSEWDTMGRVEVSRVSGNALNGVYEANLIAAPGAQVSQYDEFDITIYDRLNNRYNVEFDSGVKNIGSAFDTEDPVITRVRAVSPAVVDMEADGPQYVNIIMDIMDNKSGVCARDDDNCEMTPDLYSDEDYDDNDYVRFRDEELVRLSGDRLNGAYRLRARVTDFTTSGSFVLYVEELEDQADNEFYGELSIPISIGTPTVPSTPERNIYRFWSEKFRSHFYTSIESEKDSLIATNDDWIYESIVYSASSEDATDLTPVYRFYSSNYNSHFYTRLDAERAELVANNPNWNYEGVAYYIYDTPGAGRIPTYRFYSDVYESHFYTTSTEEKNNIEANDPNWRYEGIAWYVEG